MGGSFTTLAGQPRNRLGAVNLSNGVASAWNPDLDEVLQSMKISGNLIDVAGGFSTVGGQARGVAAAVDLTTGVPSPWAPSISAPVRAIDALGGDVRLGGFFAQISGEARTNYARYRVPTRLTALNVIDRRTIEVTFDHEMAASASEPTNYTLTGSGAGSLTGSPDSIDVIDSTLRRLNWSTGSQLLGGDLTVTALAGVECVGAVAMPQDGVVNVITALGAAVPVEFSGWAQD